MRWSIRVRDPYTDPLHLLQAELMARLREQDGDETLESALMVTIAGIAAGLQHRVAGWEPALCLLLQAFRGEASSIRPACW